jgi:broad specificity phosphatase PhoE
MTTQLWLVRHGETDWNAQGRVQGHSDVPLNAVGRLQAERLAARLVGQHFDAVVSSDLSRALETAQIVAAQLLGAPSARVDPRWREQHLGAIQGLTHDQIVTSGLPRPTTPLEAWPGAESRAQLLERVRAPLGEMHAAFQGKRVLVVSHGGTLRAAVMLLLGDLEQRLALYGHDNTVVSRVHLTGPSGGILVTLNDSAHLEPAPKN